MINANLTKGDVLMGQSALAASISRDIGEEA